MERPGRLSRSVQPGSAIKAFVAKPIGRVLLGALIVLVVVGSILYLGYLLTIPVFLLVGLALPIYLGWKRPRLLLVVGLVALVASAPIVTAIEVPILRTPTPPTSSLSTAPGFTGAVLDNATAHPFNGLPGNTFNFVVNVYPQYLPKNSSPVLWVVFFLTTCPGATGNSSPSCGSGYPFWSQNYTYNSTASRTLQWNKTLHLVNVWWWTVGAGYLNASHRLAWVFLNPGNGAGTMEGPVVGDFAAIYGLVLPSIYVEMFLYPGLVFFIALLLYVWLKARERRRKGMGSGTPAEAPAPSDAPAPAAPAGRAERPESACPKCGAVVYAGEERCWKCGAALGPTPSEAPLPSGTTPPEPDRPNSP
jgi:hypothetical protein